MKELISKIKKETAISIKGVKYNVKTKTWYSIEEDKNAIYLKCELSNNKVLVIIPDDELIYIGEVIENMQYERISENEIKFENRIFHKTGDGNQFILNIEFGEKDQVEGKCNFEDYETKFAFEYNQEKRTLGFYKNDIYLGVAFDNVPPNLTPAFEIWFEKGDIKISGNMEPQENFYL